MLPVYNVMRCVFSPLLGDTTPIVVIECGFSLKETVLIDASVA
jgi:hypothetical protein